jgi:hypothetical protein
MGMWENSLKKGTVEICDKKYQHIIYRGQNGPLGMIAAPPRSPDRRLLGGIWAICMDGTDFAKIRILTI